ncbi:MAG: PhzF family phenazine biosynthesis protein [Candidatus Krumholzibacteria bacterium]|nr:PhzF family phenazine biosynthesis protein [Candidatus Krumholzibacteria bacterium]
MKKYEIKYVDAFTTSPFHGNSVAVITDAEGLTTNDMYKIAGEINLSESTFVNSPESKGAAARIRFFTPDVEYDLSGHAMIGTCLVLADNGTITLKDGLTRVIIDTKIGPVPIEFDFEMESHRSGASVEGDHIRLTGTNRGLLRRIMMQKTVTGHRPATFDLDDIANTLGIDSGLILQTGLPMEILSNGLIQLVIPIQNHTALSNMNPDLIKLKLMNDKLGIQTVDIFTLDSLDDKSITYSRHFSPGSGLWEDPGSGTAAVSIATYLARHGVISKGSYVMKQGRELDQLCDVFVDIRETREGLESAWVGGLAVTSIKRKMSIQDQSITIV